MDSRAVAFVCPTLNRPEFHAHLHATFRAQTVSPKRLYVLDESKFPSKYFSSTKDPLVTYVHRPGKPRVGGVTRIGAARNALTAMVSEPLVQNIDDDDEWDPSLGQLLRSRIGDADVCKLDHWRCSLGNMIFSWDTRKPLGGTHFALKGGEAVQTYVDPNEMPPDVAARMNEAYRFGYGFANLATRAALLAHPYPEEGTEDIQFVRDVRDAGGKIVFVSDAANLILHVVHPKSESPVFPQRFLGAAGASELHSLVAQRMIGLMGAMTALPDGEAIHVAPGKTYSILASVKRSHSLRALTTRAASWGVTVSEARDDVPATEFGVEAPGGDYRLVHVVASSSKAATVPWKVPSPLSLFDKSRVIKAWEGAGTGVGAVERYEPGKYGSSPPHRCTAASAQAIARQLDARWTYAGTASGTGGMAEVVRHVKTQMGEKDIPTWVSKNGQEMVLQCPFASELFLFSLWDDIGAGLCLGRLY